MGKGFAFPLLHLLLLLSSQLIFLSQAQGGVVTMQLWCVAKNNAEDAALHSALDWACGPGGADCGPIQQGGPCYDPSDVQTMASYAFNNYYLKNGMTDDSCSFDNNAAVTSLNPSHDNCKFPSSTAKSNGSMASSSTAVGFGPGEDISRCDPIAHHWFWSIASGSVLFMALGWFS
ncbi:hypothetical protein UlMin_020579 [Ulmus minor]